MRVVRIHAAAWYESERYGLGAEFESAINAALDLLEEEIVPLVAMTGAAGNRGAKCLLLRRFPYAVVVVERDSTILVVAFAHHARRPSYWRDRISNEY